MPHAFVTVVVPFDASHADAVNDRLDALGNLARGPWSEALDGSGFVHFMSLTVARDPSRNIAHLVLEASADGYRRGVLRRLAREIGTELCGVLAVAGVSVEEARLGKFLVRHDRQVGQGWFAVSGVVFDGTPGMHVGRIRREAKLASRIQDILDRLPAPGSALDRLTRVREQLFSEGVYKWAFVAEAIPLLAETPVHFVGRVAWSAFRSFLWPLAILPALFLVFQGLWSAILTLGAEIVLGGGLAGIAYLRLRHKEEADVADDRRPEAPAVAEIMRRENRAVQNHLAAVSTIKPGGLRRVTLRLALWVVGAFATFRARPGFLSNIGTIHFARWIVLPRTDTLLFFSDYSGSWESYLEDFIVRGHFGLTGVWSNTQGFPKSKNLVLGGAQHGDQFKGWARRQQHPTRCWYSAYPELTTERIRINTAIRDGFATAWTEDEAASWLTHFQFAPPTSSILDVDRIPTLVFGGLPALQCGRSLVLRFSNAQGEARGWLAEIESGIGYGEGMPQNSTLVLGLSESGLRKLGLDGQALETFPTAFVHGMAAPWRSRVLGDVDENAPSHWWWGGVGNEADAILNVYARTDEILEDEVHRQRAQLLRFGIKVFHEILLAKIPPKDRPILEPFGFTDGISQPIVRGARKWVKARNQIHVVAPGELILGYEDNSGEIPMSPSTPRHANFGYNGTYLVVRQLEQDKAGFDEFIAGTAARLVGDPRVPPVNAQELGEWIAAKMVGRWRDGTSLVRHPDQPGSVTRPGTLPDNDFLFGTEDPNGLRCPFGAHIRRVNPRESFKPGSEEQLMLAKRHRIFRVGRRYGPQNGSPNPGLLFMCVNANIERQFEFMQQTYMLGSSFHGLENELDPFARRPGSSDVLTIPTANGPLHLRGMSSFVRVRGGGYFFMPGKATVRLLIDGLTASRETVRQ